MAKLMQLEILTPEKSLFQRNDVTYLFITTVYGGLGILANHAPVLATLREGPLKVQDEHKNLIFAYVEGGFVQIQDNRVVILTRQAELAQNIDKEKYMEVKKEAQARLANPDKFTDIEHTEKVLARAIGRLKTLDLAAENKTFDI